MGSDHYSNLSSGQIIVGNDHQNIPVVKWQWLYRFPVEELPVGTGAAIISQVGVADGVNGQMFKSLQF